MFLQVAVPKDDDRCLQFLWREDPEQRIEVYEYTRHVFGAKSLPTCANYSLHQVAKDNAVNDESIVRTVQQNFYIDDSLQEAIEIYQKVRDALHQVVKDNAVNDENLVKAVQRNFYMDDFLKSVRTPQEAIEIYQEVRDILIKSGFNLTKWIISDDEVKSQIRDRQVNKSRENFRSRTTIVFNTRTQLECGHRQSPCLSWNWGRSSSKNYTENCPILCLSSVRPTWDMFTLHHKNAVSTQYHLGSNRPSMWQRVDSRTLKTIQWLVLWVERNKDDVNKSTLFWKRLHKFENPHFHRRVRNSDVHRGISAIRSNF